MYDLTPRRDYVNRLDVCEEIPGALSLAADTISLASSSGLCLLHVVLRALLSRGDYCWDRGRTKGRTGGAESNEAVTRWINNRDNDVIRCCEQSARGIANTGHPGRKNSLRPGHFLRTLTKC